MTFIEMEKELGREAKDKAKGYVIAAFGLVAALAWNDAVKSLIEYFFPNKDNSILLKFIYALALTVVIIVLTKLALKPEKEYNKET